MTILSFENIKLDKHVITTEAENLQQLIAPLRQHFGITHFAYQKLHTDKTKTILTTTPLTSEIFIKEKFYKLAFHGNVDQYKSCVFLGDFLENCNPILHAARTYCNIAHHFCIVKKSEDFVEFFFFATTPENYKINNLYLNHIQILEKFIEDFKFQAKKILKRADEQRILLPEEAADTTILVDDSMRNAKLELEGPAQIQNNKFKLSKTIYMKDFKLTNREQKLVTFIIQGDSAKVIAKKLNISNRTVEHHITNMKSKLCCLNIKELIAKLISQELYFHY